jgi:hypothetical protein
MALYIVKVPAEKYAVFDDLELSFTRRGLLFAEAALLVMNTRQCPADEAMSRVFGIETGRAMHLPETSRSTDGLSLDAMLWAVSLVRGDGALLLEARKIGCPNYRPAPLEDSMGEELAELCEAYGLPVPAAAFHQRRAKISSLGGRLVSEWLAKGTRPLPRRRREPRGGGGEEGSGTRHPMPQSV